jgi:ABC-type nitrate/sulfonate/bicarbonate transport system permease component
MAISETTSSQTGKHAGRGAGTTGHFHRWLRKSAIPLTVIGLWIVVTARGSVDPVFLPSPKDVWTSFVSLSPLLPASLFASVSMTLIGFLGGSLLGLAMGLSMAYSRVAREIFGGVLDFFRPVPIFALIPLFVLWFGLGKAPQVAMIMLGTSLIIGVTTIEAIRNVPSVFVRAGLVLGASRWTIYRSIILPSISPHLLGAIRVAAAASWGLGVAAEYIGAQVGLGHLMIIRVQYLDTAAIFVIVAIYCVLAVALDKLIVWLERPLTKWTDRSANRGVVASITGSA